MRRCLCLLLASLFLASSLLAQEFAELVTKGPREDWIEPIDFSTIPLPSNPSGSAEYLLNDARHHLEKESYYREYAYLIVSEAGVEDFSQLTFDFQPEYQSLRFHELQLIRNGEVLDRLADTEIQILQQEKDSDQLLYDGARSAHLILKDVRKGDILKYAYTLKGQNPVFKGHVHNFAKLGYTSQITRCSRTILWNPSVRNLRWHLLGPTEPIDQEPQLVTVNDSLHKLTWDASPLPKYSYEDNTPGWILETPWLEYCDYADWTAFGIWANGLFEVDPQLPPELITICDKLKAEAKSDEDLIVQTLRWVQRNVRYLGSFMGSHTHQPYPIATIFERRFGDCKDQGVLTTAMLRYLSFDAAPALVNTARWDRLTDYFPGHGAFNHLIVHLRWQDEDFWLDPTYTFQGGTLHNLHSTNLRYAFVAREGETDLRNVEPRGLNVSLTTIHDDLTIHNLAGRATFLVKTVTTGDDANSARRYFARKSLDSINEDYLEFYQSFYPGTKSVKPLTFTDDPESNTFTTIEHYEVDNIWTREEGDEENEGYRYASLSGYLLDDKLNYPDEGKRNLPYSVSFPQNLKHTVRAKLPIDWDIENASEVIKCDAFTSRVKSTYANRVLNLEFSYRALARSVSPEDYQTYSKRLEKLLDEINYSVYIYDENDEVTEPKETESTIGYLLWGSGLMLGLMIGGVTTTLLYFFWNPNPRLPQTTAFMGIGGWLILPTIGILLAPFWQLGFLKSFFSALPEMESYFESETGWVGWRLYYFLNGFEGGFLLFLTVLLIVFLFTKRTAFPYFYLILLVIRFLSQGLEMFWETTLPDYDSEGENVGELVKLLFQGLIWGSYMMMSNRVKATFVHRRGPPSSPPALPS
ncbi:MAG: DUF3857 domain-containing protein [Verrucomicrobiaceae bacterium]